MRTDYGTNYVFAFAELRSAIRTIRPTTGVDLTTPETCPEMIVLIILFIIWAQTSFRGSAWIHFHGFWGSIAKYPYPTPHLSCLDRHLFDLHHLLLSKPKLHGRKCNVVFRRKLHDQSRNSALSRHPLLREGVDAVFDFILRPRDAEGTHDVRLQHLATRPRCAPVATAEEWHLFQDVWEQSLLDGVLLLCGIGCVRHALLRTRARPVAALTLIGEDYLATHLRLVSRLVVHTIRFVFDCHLVATRDLLALHSPPKQNTELYTDPFSCLLGKLLNVHPELVIVLMSENPHLMRECDIMCVVLRKHDHEVGLTLPIVFDPFRNRVDRVLTIVDILPPVCLQRLLNALVQ